MEDYGVCPWNGKECPGEKACAPAIMKSNILNYGRDPEFEEIVQPQCPIVEISDAANRASVSIQPLLDMVMGPVTPAELTEEERRDQVIRDLKIDQD